LHTTGAPELWGTRTLLEKVWASSKYEFEEAHGQLMPVTSFNLHSHYSAPRGVTRGHIWDPLCRFFQSCRLPGLPGRLPHQFSTGFPRRTSRCLGPSCLCARRPLRGGV